MGEQFVIRLITRFRPRHGWLPFILLTGVLGSLVFSVLEVEWVEQDWVVVPAVLLGLVAAALLAQRNIHSAAAWGLLVVGGLGVALVLAAQLWPPLRLWFDGAALAQYWQLRWALFTDQTLGWLAAVRGGGRSTETVVFTLGMALTGWLVAAALAWSAYRTRRPFLGLTLVGLAVVANTFYGRPGLYWVVFFFGLAITAGTYLAYLWREVAWEQAGVDYSAEVRGDLLVYAAGVSLGIMSLAMAIPAINFRAIAEAFQRQEAVVAAEQTMARAFAGVAQPRVDEGTIGAGSLPRSFLLGGDPRLAATQVMTATVDAPGNTLPDLSRFHWRSVSFDVYTGRGWARSPEREEKIGRGQIIPAAAGLAEDVVSVSLTQEVNWTYDRRVTRYTLGRPVAFSHDLATLWRGVDDLVGVRGRNAPPTRYTAETQIILPSAAQLRAALPEGIPPEIMARYTALPASVPDRVRQLAADVAGDPAARSAYDQARAIEQFLRQYPYTLDLSTPPGDVDIVDYFLFDLQTGFCDYYASAMVVMARAVGIPARLGVGFLQQPVGPDGAQTIRQLDAHSWAEVYFAGYGWVEFEPTAPFAAAPAEATAATPAPQATYEPFANPSPAIPERAPRRETPWLLFIGLAALTVVLWRLWGRGLRARQRADAALDATQLAYARLQRGAAAIGFPPHPTDTPAEFADRLMSAPLLRDAPTSEWRAAVARLAHLFARRQYGGAPDAAEAPALWDTLRAPLRRLAWQTRLNGLRKLTQRTPRGKER